MFYIKLIVQYITVSSLSISLYVMFVSCQFKILFYVLNSILKHLSTSTKTLNYSCVETQAVNSICSVDRKTVQLF